MMLNDPSSVPPLSARWYRQRVRSATSRELSLTQILALRRLRDGMEQAEAAVDMNVPKHVVETALRSARIAYGVRRTRELLDFSEVLNQLREDL